MNTAIQKAEPQVTFDADRVDLIKRTICRGSTDDELQLFIDVCKRTRLDPFARQIHAAKRWDSKEGREVMSIQVGIDGLRLVAERTDEYAPGPKPVFQEKADGSLLCATASIKKWKRGEWHVVEADAYFDEYVQRKKDGTPTSFWLKMPRIMLGKCAEALALRRAFPAELSGLYAPEEMGQPESAVALDENQTAIAAGLAEEKRLAANLVDDWLKNDLKALVEKQDAEGLEAFCHFNGAEIRSLPATPSARMFRALLKAGGLLGIGPDAVKRWVASAPDAIDQEEEPEQ